MWWTRIVTNVPPTSGALAVTWGASHVVVTLPIHYGLTATCSQGNVTVCRALEGVFAPNAKKITGVTRNVSA